MIIAKDILKEVNVNSKKAFKSLVKEVENELKAMASRGDYSTEVDVTDISNNNLDELGNLLRDSGYKYSFNTRVDDASTEHSSHFYISIFHLR